MAALYTPCVASLFMTLIFFTHLWCLPPSGLRHKKAKNVHVCEVNFPSPPSTCMRYSNKARKTQRHGFPKKKKFNFLQMWCVLVRKCAVWAWGHKKIWWNIQSATVEKKSYSFSCIVYFFLARFWLWTRFNIKKSHARRNWTIFDNLRIRTFYLWSFSNYYLIYF